MSSFLFVLATVVLTVVATVYFKPAVTRESHREGQLTGPERDR